MKQTKQQGRQMQKLELGMELSSLCNRVSISESKLGPKYEEAANHP